MRFPQGPFQWIFSVATMNTYKNQWSGQQKQDPALSVEQKTKSVTLSQKKIYILPTKEGLFFLLTVILAIMVAINYQNSLIFSIAFLLLSLFIVGIFHTYRNLEGLTLTAPDGRSVFLSEDAEFRVTISSKTQRRYEALQLGWDPEFRKEVDLEIEESIVGLFVTTTKRGFLDPGRLLIETRYPLGLFRAWSRVDLDVSCIVYPKPISAPHIPLSATTSDDGETSLTEGSEDFYGLREYQKGDSLKHVDWKSYARSDRLFTKQFESSVDQTLWLEWDSLQGLETEDRLSRLCFWVIQYSTTDAAYGLRLPDVEISPSKGSIHRQKLLVALALFDRSIIK